MQKLHFKSSFEFAKEECCNFQGKNECLGLPLFGIMSGSKEGLCVVGTKNESCDVFDMYLRPLAQKKGIKLHESIRTFRGCKICGGPVKKYKRYCDTCLETREKSKKTGRRRGRPRKGEKNEV